LPSDAEWNYAASGGSQQRYFPWSKPSTSQFIDTTYASYGTGSYTICLGDGVPACSVADIHFVGTKPLGNGYWGHADLAGNLTEWVADWNRSATASMCTDCVGGAEDNERGFRGGEYGASPDALAAAIYGWGNPPDVHTTATGIRCARTP
jgi:formylglycine-generating enzyme required for sulfatase activity